MNCNLCHNSGIEFVMCCQSGECNCFGYPVQSTNCDCGQQICTALLTDEEHSIFNEVPFVEKPVILQSVNQVIDQAFYEIFGVTGHE